MAWRSIDEEREQLNLDAFQSNQARTKREQADEAVKARILETYSWVLVPTQPDPQGPVEWQELRVQGQEPPAVRAGRKLKTEELLITGLAATRLRYELDRALWSGRDHIGLKQLWEYLATYLYLPKLRDREVMLSAVHHGVASLTWSSETFAYAERWDEAQGRYVGLVAGQHAPIVLDGQSVLVRPEVALRQIEADAVRRREEDGCKSGAFGGDHTAGTTSDARRCAEKPEGYDVGTGAANAAPPRLRRFHGSVDLDPLRTGRDAGRIAEEVLQHLSSLTNAKVRVTLEIEAQMPDGAPEHVIRTVSENCRSLKFRSQAFEEE
jgi:hypothetical protein